MTFFMQRRLLIARSYRRGLVLTAATFSLLPFAPSPAHAGTVNWTGGAGTVFWDSPTNWNPAALPGALDDVFDLTGASITHRNGTDTINSLTTNGAITVSGGSLSITSSLTFNSGGSLTLTGGTLANAHISNSTRLFFDTATQTSLLDNVTLVGDGTTILNIGSSSNGGFVRVADSFTFSNGSVFNLGASGTGGSLFFDSTAANANPTFDNATVNLGGNGSYLGFGKNYSAGSPLTLGSNLTVQGGGTIGGTFFSNSGANLVNNGTLISNGVLSVTGASGGSITNNGTIKVGANNATLAISTSGAGTFTNNGSVQVSGIGVASSISGNVATLGNVSVTGPIAVLNLNANLTTAQLSGLTVAGGGRVNFGGGKTLTNTGSTFDLTAITGANNANGTIALNSYTIQGGTLKNSHLLGFTSATANILSDVALVGDGTAILNIGTSGTAGYAHLGGAYSFSNGNVFNVSASPTASGVGYLMIDSTSGVPNPTFDNATVNLGNTIAGTNGNLIFGSGYTTGRTLTLGSNLLVQGSGSVGSNGVSDATGATLINNGTISANGENTTLSVVGANNGNIINNNVMQTGSTNNTLSISTSGTGALTNNGVIRALGGSTVNISGTTVFLGTITATDGSRINLGGTVTNTGRTINVTDIIGPNGANGSLYLNTATINGGTIANSHLLRFTATTSLLDNVTLTGDGTTILTIGDNTYSPVVRIADSFSFSNGSTFNVGPGTKTSLLLFDSTAGTPNPTFDNATVNLGNGGVSGTLGFGNGYTTGRTLTLGSNLVVQGKSGSIGTNTSFSPSNAALVNNGTIQSNVASGTFTISGAASGTITNNGTIQANASGSSVTIRSNGTGTFTNKGTLNIAAGSTATLNITNANQSGGNTIVNGGLTLTGLSTTYIVNGGTIGGSGTMTGGLNNAAGTLLPGGIGSAGTLSLTGAYTQGSSGTLLTEIGGTTQGSQYDFFKTTGNASLNGTLTVSLINGFTPTAGNLFQIMAFGSNTASTAFANTPGNLITSSDGLYAFNVLYQSNGVYLQATGAAAPEPTSLLLAIPGLLPIACIVRRRRKG